MPVLPTGRATLATSMKGRQQVCFPILFHAVVLLKDSPSSFVLFCAVFIPFWELPSLATLVDLSYFSATDTNSCAASATFPLRFAEKVGSAFPGSGAERSSQDSLLAHLFQVLLKTRHSSLVGDLSQKSALLQYPQLFSVARYLCLQLHVSAVSHLQVSLKALQHDLGLLQLLS